MVEIQKWKINASLFAGAIQVFSNSIYSEGKKITEEKVAMIGECENFLKYRIKNRS